MKRVIFTKSSSFGRCLLSSAAAKSRLPADITIPLAIERSPTAVLEALSSTVGVDPTAPHFAFVDDPAMIPSTTKSKLYYFSAKEMGKRAARQLAEEWPTLFAFDRDQPELTAFRPKKATEQLEENAAVEAEKKEVSWTEAVAAFKEMKKAGTKPTLSTMNNLLRSANSAPNSLLAIQQVVGEMTVLKIVPSLTSYRLMIGHTIENWPSDKELENKESVKYTKLQLVLTWLVEILEELEQRNVLEIEGSQDYDFFYVAMIAARRSENLAIAEKVMNLYESEKNKVKMPFFDTEDGFYRNYLALYVDTTNSIEGITEKYKSFVPRLVGGNRVIAQKISEKLKTMPHWPLLRRVVEDGITARFIADSKSAGMFRNSLITFPYQNLSVTERDEYRDLIVRLVDIWTELSNFTEEFNKRLQVKFSPQSISECALLLNRVGEADRGYKMLEMLMDPENSHGDNTTIIATGHARQSAMAELFETALHEKDVYRASICLEVMSQYTSKNKLDMLARRIHDSCKLTENQARIINGFVRLRPE